MQKISEKTVIQSTVVTTNLKDKNKSGTLKIFYNRVYEIDHTLFWSNDDNVHQLSDPYMLSTCLIDDININYRDVKHGLFEVVLKQNLFKNNKLVMLRMNRDQKEMMMDRALSLGFVYVPYILINELDYILYYSQNKRGKMFTDYLEDLLTSAPDNVDKRVIADITTSITLARLKEGLTNV